MTADILASGGVVVRPGRGGEPEVLVVHRPKYDDWSLPKGKEEAGESAEQAAVREVEEETGHRARIVARLPDARYSVGPQSKLVRWFLMRPIGNGAFVPDDEVDQVRWVNLDEAAELVDYRHDRELLADPRVRSAARSGSVFLLRHAAAGSRQSWEGDDRLRPLTGKGRRQSAELASSLGQRGVTRIMSSAYVRCVQTVEPLAETLGLEVETHPLLAEGSDVRALADLVSGLAGAEAVMCSHGDMIPGVLERLSNAGTELRSPTGSFDCKKGSVWTVELEEGRPTVATYSPPPEVSAQPR